MLYLEAGLWYDLCAAAYSVMSTVNIQIMRCDYAYHLPPEGRLLAAF